MKTPIAISVLILVAGGLVGWRQSVAYEKAVVVHREVVAEAARLGVEPGDVEGSEEAAAKLSLRDREDQEAAARAFARDMVAFAKEMEEMRGSSGQPDEKQQERIFAFMNRLMELDGVQLKLVIDEVRKTPELDDDTRRGMLGFTIMMLAQEHPEMALAMFTESSDMIAEGQIHRHVVSVSLSRLATDNPGAAMKWIKENAEEHPELVDERTRSGVFRGLAMHDPALAIDYLDELELGDGSGSAAFGLAQAARSEEQRGEVLAALRRKGDDDLTRSTLSQMTSNLAGEGFEAATGWIDEAGLSTEERRWAADGVVAAQISGDTARWIEWTGKELGGDGDDSIRQMVRRWTESDYQAAGEWLAGAEAGPTKQVAVRSYAETVAPYDPGAAAQWARTLPKGEERRRLSRTILQHWQDEEAAARFAAEEGLEQD